MSRKGNKKIKSVEENNKFKAAIYIRTDIKPNNEIDTLKVQEERLEEYCMEKKIKIKEKYIDLGVDDLKKERKEYERMIRDIDNGNINLIVVTTLSRIARNAKEFEEIIKKKEDYNIRIIASDSNEEIEI